MPVWVKKELGASCRAPLTVGLGVGRGGSNCIKQGQASPLQDVSGAGSIWLSGCTLAQGQIKTEAQQQPRRLENSSALPPSLFSGQELPKNYPIEKFLNKPDFRPFLYPSILPDKR